MVSELTPLTHVLTPLKRLECFRGSDWSGTYFRRWGGEVKAGIWGWTIGFLEIAGGEGVREAAGFTATRGGDRRSVR